MNGLNVMVKVRQNAGRGTVAGCCVLFVGTDKTVTEMRCAVTTAAYQWDARVRLHNDVLALGRRGCLHHEVLALG